MQFIFTWFLNKKIREIWEYRKAILKQLRAREDLLQPEEVVLIKEKAEVLKKALLRNASEEEINAAVESLNQVSESAVKPYPHATLRDIFEVALVAVAIALAARTFFIQPMKIPTSSMQPTLYGVTGENLKETDPDAEIPNIFNRFINIKSTISNWIINRIKMILFISNLFYKNFFSTSRY